MNKIIKRNSVLINLFAGILWMLGYIMHYLYVLVRIDVSVYVVTAAIILAVVILGFIYKICILYKKPYVLMIMTFIHIFAGYLSKQYKDEMTSVYLIGLAAVMVLISGYGRMIQRFVFFGFIIVTMVSALILTGDSKLYRTSEIKNEIMNSIGNTIDSAEYSENNDYESYIEQTDSKIRGNIIIGIFVLPLIICDFIFIYILFRDNIRRHMWCMRLEHLDSESKSVVLCDRINSLVSSFVPDAVTGWKAQRTDDVLRKYINGMYDGEYLYIHSIMEKFLFGEKKLEVWEIRSMISFEKKLTHGQKQIKNKKEK